MAAGYPLAVFKRGPLPAAFTDSTSRASARAHVKSRSDPTWSILMLPDTPDVEAVLFGDRRRRGRTETPAGRSWT